MSQHAWRGYAMSTLPTIEPTAELSTKYFTGGIWGALSVDGDYFEIDTYLKATYSGFSLGLYDYYCPPSIYSQQSLFNYKQTTTNHTLDLYAEYQGGSLFPVRFMIATMIYGDDINKITNKNFYSTYFELAIFSNIKNIYLEYFMGFNAYESYYGDKPALINAGIKANGKINVFKKSKIDLKTSIITNPLANRVYLVFGVSLP
ncbi:MAG: hypothetical protein AB7S50_07560 [Bacteroidales bacterium]